MENGYVAREYQKMSGNGAKAPRHPSTPRGLFYAPTCAPHRKTNPQPPLSHDGGVWNPPLPDGIRSVRPA
jgi:hypothetical protein